MKQSRKALSDNEKLVILAILVGTACVYWVLALAAARVDAIERIYGKSVTIYDVLLKSEHEALEIPSRDVR